VHSLAIGQCALANKTNRVVGTGAKAPPAIKSGLAGCRGINPCGTAYAAPGSRSLLAHCMAFGHKKKKPPKWWLSVIYFRTCLS